jgi:hypothetical protein
VSETFVSAIKPAPKVKRTPADLLSERKTLMRRVPGVDLPTVQQLERHAARFGSEQVVETAIECGHSFDSCVRLQDSCDRSDLELLRKLRPKARPERKAASEDRVSLLMGIEREAA